MGACSIDTLHSGDWPAVASILAEGIATGCTAVETAVPSWEERDAAHLPAPRLVAASEAAGLGTLQAVVFPENGASISLHRRCGFRLVGRRERLARLGTRWQDTLLFERRPPGSGLEEP